MPYLCDNRLRKKFVVNLFPYNLQESTRYHLWPARGLTTHFLNTNGGPFLRITKYIAT